MSSPVHCRIAASLLASLFVLTACSPGADTPSQVADVDAAPTVFHGTMLAASPGRPELTLRDTENQEFSLTERPEGEVTVVFFGYTHCSDVCPTTMADLAVASRQLRPELREQVTVVFVTEDPRRDTPAALRQWLDQFDSTFVGLLGGNPATEAALAELALPESTQIPQPDDPIVHPDTGDGSHDHGDYAIEHSGIVYAFGPIATRTAIVYTGGFSPRQYAEDFTRLAETG